MSMAKSRFFGGTVKDAGSNVSLLLLLFVLLLLSATMVMTTWIGENNLLQFHTRVDTI
jgi:hypothetical protein